jgi:hypothetical protein
MALRSGARSRLAGEEDHRGLGPHESVPAAVVRADEDLHMSGFDINIF